jgi:hypothetical protein
VADDTWASVDPNDPVIEPPKPSLGDKIKSGLESAGQTASDLGEGLFKPFLPGYAVLTAGVDKADEVVPDVATMVGRVTSIVPGAYDEAATALTGKPHVAAYDWWNRNMVQPGVDFSNRLEAESNQLAQATGPAGEALQTAGAIAGTYLEIEAMGRPGVPAISSQLPREGLSGAMDVAKSVATSSARQAAIPEMVAATKANAAVYQQTGDPLAAVKAGITAAMTTGTALAIPMNLDGKLLYRAAMGASTAPLVQEGTREINNASLPENMQEPFSWKGVVQNAVTRPSSRRPRTVLLLSIPRPVSRSRVTRMQAKSPSMRRSTNIPN